MEIRIESLGVNPKVYTDIIAPLQAQTEATKTETAAAEQTSFSDTLSEELSALSGSSSSASSVTWSEDASTASLEAIFAEASDKYAIDAGLLKAVARTESDFRPNAVSSAGAVGIMQLMPGTATEMGVTNSYDPYQNIMGGAKYLREMINRYGGDINLALGAYNAGPGNVDAYGGVPPYSTGYVEKVLGYFREGVSAPDVTYVRTGSAAANAAGVTGTVATESGTTTKTAAELQNELEQLLYEYSKSEAGKTALTEVLRKITS